MLRVLTEELGQCCSCQSRAFRVPRLTLLHRRHGYDP